MAAILESLRVLSGTPQIEANTGVNTSVEMADGVLPLVDIATDPFREYPGREKFVRQWKTHLQNPARLELQERVSAATDSEYAHASAARNLGLFDESWAMVSGNRALFYSWEINRNSDQPGASLVLFHQMAPHTKRGESLFRELTRRYKELDVWTQTPPENRRRFKQSYQEASESEGLDLEVLMQEEREAQPLVSIDGNHAVVDQDSRAGFDNETRSTFNGHIFTPEDEWVLDDWETVVGYAMDYLRQDPRGRIDLYRRFANKAGLDKDLREVVGRLDTAFRIQTGTFYDVPENGKTETREIVGPKYRFGKTKPLEENWRGVRHVVDILENVELNLIIKRSKVNPSVCRELLDYLESAANLGAENGIAKVLDEVREIEGITYPVYVLHPRKLPGRFTTEAKRHIVAFVLWQDKGGQEVIVLDKSGFYTEADFQSTYYPTTKGRRKA